MLPRLVRARAWIVALGVIVALTYLAQSRPASEAPLLLAMAALATVLPRRTRLRLPLVGEIGRHREAFTAGIIALLGLLTFGPIVRAGEAGYHCDWSQNIAVVEEIVQEWSHGRPTPAVFLGIAAGDPTPDLYPTLPHQLAAVIAYLMGGASHAHMVTMVIVLVAWIAAAVGVTRLALCFSAWPVALLAGLACLFDSTEMFQWSLSGTWYWGLFPSTCAIGVLVNGLPSLARMLEAPPTRGQMVTAWALIGLGAMTHPIALLMSIVIFGSAVLGTAFARRERRLRWASVALHVGIALGLAAFAWLPATTRLMLYAVHYGNPQIPVWLALERCVTGLFPQTSFATLMGFSVFTLLSGRRGAAWAWLAAWIALSLYMEPLFLDLGLAPTPSSARIQCFRTTSVAMPLLYAASGALFSAPAAVPHGRYGKVTRFVPALAFLAAIGWLGSAPFETGASWARSHAETGLRLVSEVRITNRPAFEEMLSWFREQAAALPPGQYARVAYECGGDPINEVLRIHPESGLPVTTHGRFVPIFLAREQFHATTPDNLQRWAVRWSIGADQVEPRGDPATERRFGILRVREVPSWDGQLVHVVRGEGTARLAEIDDAHLAIDVEAAAPVLVEMGIPYYPRWRGEHEGSAITPCGEPVDAAAPTEERVLAAWLPPGRTVLTPDGPLPSDRAGWPLTLLGLVLAAVIWPRRSPLALDARLAPVRAAARAFVVRHSGAAVLATACVVAVVLPARQGAFGGTARSLRFGGMFAPAQIDVVTPEGRVPCEARDLLGHDVRCPGGVRALLVVTHNVYDAAVGWPVPLPGVLINSGGTFELVFHAAGTWSPGEHRLFCGGGCRRVGIVIDGVERSFDAQQTRVFELDHTEEGLDVHVYGVSGETPISIVRSDAVDVDRHHDVPVCGESP